MEAARRARPDDLAAAADVLTRAAAEAAGQRGGDLYLAREAALTGPLAATPAHEGLRTRIEAALADPGRVAVVGCYDGVVLGWAEARVETLGDGRRLGVLDALAVDPEARGAGIGEAMMDLVLAELRSAGCIGVDAHALPGDRATKNFFESFGLKARLLTVHRSFDDRAPDGGTDTGPA